MTLLTKIQTLLHEWFPNKTDDRNNFDTWSDEALVYTNGELMCGNVYIENISDVTSLYLADSKNPFQHNCTHSVTYDSETGYTQIRINEGNSNNTGSKYYMAIPFIIKGDIDLSVDFYTTGMGNDDFGIRIADKANRNHSYGGWIITGQGKLVYGYGGLETNNTKYYDGRPSGLTNNVTMNFTMKLTSSTVFFSLKKLSDNTILKEGTYNRTDNYEWSGKFYLYIGGGKFTTGSADKSVYIKNVKVKAL